MTGSSPPFEHLFSYGTLQQDAVQLATFGRKLAGRQDRLPGYRLSLIAIGDPAVVATSGKSHHPMVSRTGSPEDSVEGAVLLVTSDELAQADRYEVADYRRDRVLLSSGQAAWAYVDARDPVS